MRTLVVVLVLSAVAPIAAQRSGRTDVTRDIVAIVYNDMEVPDEDRAKLVTFLASVIPVESWASVQLTGPTTVECLIDEFFDYFPRDQFGTPRTVEALRTAILRYNEQLGAQSQIPATLLRLPPFPVHAYHVGRPQTSRRIFDAQSRAYQIIDGANELRPDPDAGVNGVYGRTRCSTAEVTAANPPQRTLVVVATTILVPALPGDVKRLSEQLGSSRAVGILNTTINPAATNANRDFKSGYSSVEVPDVSADASQPCADGRNWLTTSPYFKYWATNNVAARFDQEALAKLAIEQPLRILDVKFNGGHGAEVLSVTRQLLRQLGFSTILREQARTVRPWELVPSTLDASSESLAFLKTYRKQFRVDDPILKLLEPDAEAWLNDTQHDVDNGFDVPDLVLSSVMWHTFRDDMWLNVSSRMRTPVLNDMVDPVVIESKGALFAAVGNTPKELTTGFVPQDHAAKFLNVINVTCGRQAGQICGEHSHEGASKARRVLIAGPGCGFDGTSGIGSSLATPYVATASWLAHLLSNDATTATNSERLAEVRRHNVLAANVPTPGLSKRVESRGLFDPAYLLLQPPPHAIMRDDTLRLVTDYRVTPTCVGESLGAALPPQTNVQSPTPITETILVHRDADNAPRYWKRQMVSDDASISDCVLETLDVDVTFKDGERKTYDLTSFQEAIKWITWTPHRWPDPQP